MKDAINLLPSQAIKTRTARIYIVRSGRIIRRLLAGMLLINATLIGTYVAIVYIEQKVIEDISSRGASTDLIEELQQTNTRLSEINDWTTEFEPLSPNVRDVLELMPSGTTIVRLGGNLNEDTYEVTGRNDERQKVLELQQLLEQLPWVETVDAPLSNFQTGQESQFTFTLVRKKLEALSTSTQPSSTPSASPVL